MNGSSPKVIRHMVRIVCIVHQFLFCGIFKKNQQNNQKMDLRRVVSIVAKNDSIMLLIAEDFVNKMSSNGKKAYNGSDILVTCIHCGF